MPFFLLPVLFSPLMAAESSPKVTLASYTVCYSENKEAAQCSFLVSAPENKQIRECRAAELLLTDEEDNAIDYTATGSREVDGNHPNQKIIPVLLHDAPGSHNLRIEGEIKVALAGGEEVHPAETIAYGEEKNLAYGGAGISFLQGHNNEVVVVPSDVRAQLKSITYKLHGDSSIKEIELLSASGAPLQVIGESMVSGMLTDLQVIWVIAPPGEEKSFQVRVTTYKEETEATVPIRLNLNLRNMQVTEWEKEEN